MLSIGQIVEYVRRLERRVSELEKQDTVQCPESVLNALQVLQVCQGLEDDDIGDQEKALVRQMCNVSKTEYVNIHTGMK